MTVLTHHVFGASFFGHIFVVPFNLGGQRRYHHSHCETDVFADSDLLIERLLDDHRRTGRFRLIRLSRSRRLLDSSISDTYLRCRNRFADAVDGLARVNSQRSGRFFRRRFRLRCTECENIAGFDFFAVFKPVEDWRRDTDHFTLE